MKPWKLAAMLAIAVLLTSSCGTARKYTPVELPHDSFLFIIKRITFSICQSDLPNQSVEQKQNPLQPKGDSCAPIGQAAISGSGFVVATNGVDSWGITAGHVCATEKVQLKAPDGKIIEPKVEGFIRVMVLGGVAYNAEIDSIYPSLDMCVLKINGMTPTQVVEVSKRAPIRGERHYVMAAPLGTFGPDLLPIFEGFYNGRTMNYPPPMGGEQLPYSVFTIPTKGGSSGSPILNSEGRLVGVTSGTLVGFENIAFSPPYEGVRSVVESVQAKAKASLDKPAEQPDAVPTGGDSNGK